MQGPRLHQLSRPARWSGSAGVTRAAASSSPFCLPCAWAPHAAGAACPTRRHSRTARAPAPPSAAHPAPPAPCSSSACPMHHRLRALVACVLLRSTAPCCGLLRTQLAQPRAVKCIRGERECIFGSPLSSDANCMFAMHALLEINFVTHCEFGEG
jgi:hypothetical protein